MGITVFTDNPKKDERNKMAHPGFNIKVRKVSNGYMIHTSVLRDGGEDHDDHVVMEDSVETYVNEIVRREIDSLKGLR